MSSANDDSSGKELTVMEAEALQDGGEEGEVEEARKPDVPYIDVYREKPIRVTVKVLIPINEHPKVI